MGSGMVSGFLGTLTTEERTLLHLLDNQLPKTIGKLRWNSPKQVSQQPFMCNENTFQDIETFAGAGLPQHNESTCPRCSTTTACLLIDA